MIINNSLRSSAMCAESLCVRACVHLSRYKSESNSLNSHTISSVP